MSIRKLMFLSFIFFLLPISVINAALPALSVRHIYYRDARFKNKQDCLEAGGRWNSYRAYHDLTYVCQFKATDGGEMCKNDDQCKSKVCVPSKDSVGITIGTCDSWIPSLDSHNERFGSDGKIEHWI